VPRYGRLLRIDPETLEVTSSTTISDMLLPGVAGKALGFGEGALWITEMGYLTRIDPDSNSIVASIPVPGTGCGPLAIGFGGGKVWTTKAGHPGPSLVAIDPGTNEATAAVWIQEPEGGGGSIFNITGTDDAIWVTRMASLLQRVSITDIPPGETTAATPCA
jgi:streptogramin lyase